MKQMKKKVAALMIALSAVTVAVVGAQPPAGNGGTGAGGGPRQGRSGIEIQVVADTLGIDLQTLQTDLQNGQTIAELATAQNVQLSTIIDAVVAKRTTELTQSVTDGQLTQAQADAQIALLKANLNVQVNKAMNAAANQPKPGSTAPQANPGQRGNDQLTVIAQALGIDAATLQTDLQNGQTIADIATAQKVELSAITDAVVAARTTTLTQAVSDGTLTQEQADAQILVLKADLEARYSQQWNANNQMGPGGNGGPDGNFPPNGQDGQPPRGGNGGQHPQGAPANPPTDGTSTGSST